jgi:H+/Cl- antiporter ClcA
LLIGAGILLVIVGLLAIVAERAGIHLGRLPGDLRIEGKRGAFYFPVMTCIIISVAASLISWFFRSK